MKEPEAFTSSIAPLITRYLAMKRALGRRAVTMAYTLRYIDRFLASCRAADLTRETFTAWSESMTSLHSNTRLARLRAVYHLCLFRQREHPHSFVPDPTQFPLSGPRLQPYIFSEAEIVRLLITAEALPPHKGSPLHCEVARVGIIILYTTGLRRGELVRLTLSDYDQGDRVFHVRRSKFDKSRLVPLSADATREIDRYLAARCQAGAPRGGDAPLLVHNHGARFRGYTGRVSAVYCVRWCGRPTFGHPEAGHHGSTTSGSLLRSMHSCAGTVQAPMCKLDCPLWLPTWDTYRSSPRSIT